MIKKKLYPIVSVGTPLKFIEKMGISCTDDEFLILVEQNPFFNNFVELIPESQYAQELNNTHVASHSILVEFRKCIESNDSLDEKYKKTEWMYDNHPQFKQACDLEGYPETLTVLEMAIIRELELYGVENALLMYESGYRDIIHMDNAKITAFASQFGDLKDEMYKKSQESVSRLIRHIEMQNVSVWWQDHASNE